MTAMHHKLVPFLGIAYWGTDSLFRYKLVFLFRGLQTGVKSAGWEKRICIQEVSASALTK